MPTRRVVAVSASLATLLGATTATAHLFDHPVPSQTRGAPLSSTVLSGGPNADWELIASLPTGNPHSDLDFFTHKGETYASVGTLAAGANGGGQTIVKLTEKGAVVPTLAGNHPSAACPSNPTSALGLQHDVEATPKGDTILNAPNPFAAKGDAQLLVESTDGGGRCHDQGVLGFSAVPQGGLEIIDITNPAAPKEIGLTSHIGQAHTVNVDPKRPHIAFDITQDGVNIDGGKRANETASNNALDGFEVVDMSSCMNFPAGTTIAQKRERCRPQVYRYRYPVPEIGKSHTYDVLQSCHEVEIYADDRLTCASIDATAVFDLSGAFDDRGTPNDFTDDKPRGTPLPCAVRKSTSQGPFTTGAMVTDCVDGIRNGAAQSLTVFNWLKIGAPSLEGVEWVGTVPHMGFRGAEKIVDTPYNANDDIVAAHESELTGSGRFVFTSDERGGGVVPGSAGCSPGADPPKAGNGGIHAFPIASFTTKPPSLGTAAANKAASDKLWARTSENKKAIYRTPIRTGPQATICTAHVFQLIPGQNRIFMAWYSQGTQVVDFKENADGTIDFANAGYFIPEGANTWSSGIFKVQQNQDGTFTYWGLTGDFGRQGMDVYKVTLGAPQKPQTADGKDAPGTPTFPVSETKGVENTRGGGADCVRAAAFESTRVAPRNRGLAFSFTRRGSAPVDVDLFSLTKGRRIRGELSVADFGPRKQRFAWNGKGRRVRDGYYTARFKTKALDGSTDTRRVALKRTGGRFRVLPAFDVREACGLLRQTKLQRPVFKRDLKLSFKLAQDSKVQIVVRRGAKVVKRVAAKNYAAGRTHRVTLRRLGSRRGAYKVTLEARRPGGSASRTLTATRL